MTSKFYWNRKKIASTAELPGGDMKFLVGIDLLSRGIDRSTIGADGLNDSVRNGKR